MRNRISQCFTQGFLGILEDLPSKHTIDEYCLTHSSQDVDFGVLDHLGYGTFKSAAVYKPGALRGFLLLGSSVVLDERDHELWQKLLGIFSKHQESCQGRPRHYSISCGDVQA